jgi:hypothetical protein
VVRAIRKLRLSRFAVRRGAPVIVSWQQTQPATVDASVGSARARAPALLAGELTAGPQSSTLDAARLNALPDGTYTVAVRARTPAGEQVLRASFKLDRGAPTARLVRFRRGKRSAFLVVRLPEAATVRVIAGARVVVARRLRAAGLNGFRFHLPAGVPPRVRLQLVDRAGNAGSAGPFVTRSRTS